MNLTSKNDTQLISDLTSLRTREKAVIAELLHHLREVDRRNIHLEKGYSSMHDFCRDELGYSKDEAHIRVQAMRLLKVIPAVEEKIRAGTLSLSVVAQAQSVFRREEQRRAKQKSEPLTIQQKALVIQTLECQPSRQSDRILAKEFPEVHQALPEKTKVAAHGRTSIQLSIGPELMAKLERLKELLAHKNFNGSWEGLLNELADISLVKLASKQRIEKGKACNTTSEVPKTTPKLQVEITREANRQNLQQSGAYRRVRRYISVHIRREVWGAAQGQCEFRDPASGRRCNGRHGLQIDHVQPLAFGGSDERKNLRLLCGAHNRYLAEKYIGVKRTLSSEIY